MRVAEAILEGFPEAVLLLEHDRVTWANRRAEALLGRPKGLVGTTLLELVGEKELQRLVLLRDQRAAGWPLPDTCRVRFLAADSAPLPLDLRFGQLEDGRSVITARDAREATRAEMLMGQLAEQSSQTLLRDEHALFEATEKVFLDLNWVVSLTRILPEGSRVERIIARPDSPVGNYGRSIIGVVQGRELTPVLHAVATTRRALFLDNIPTMVEPPLGASRLSSSMSAAHVARSAWCPIFSPELTHLLAITSADLTEHDFAVIQLFAAQVGATIRLTELRRELLRNERLAAIGQTSTMLAHELRSPLSVVFNVVTALRQWQRGLQVPASHVEQHAALIGMLEEEAQRLGHLVSDLLDFGRGSAPQFQQVKIAEVIADALDAAQHEASWRANRPQVDVHPGPPGLEVWTDASQLRRVVLNLVVNATQHVAPGGKVTVEAVPGEAEVRVRVWNEGTPLAADVLPRVFEPFFTTRAGGTGLGLAIANRICTDLKARIAVEPGNTGVSFVVTVPLRPGV